MLEARRRRPGLRLLRTMQPVADERMGSLSRSNSETQMSIYHPTVLGLGQKNAFFHLTGGQSKRAAHYEMAGISSHGWPEMIPTQGLPNQQTADARPVFRADVYNLTRWTHGRHREKPPAARYFHGKLGHATDAFSPSMDGHGHFAGGVRLPHVASTVHGRIAGAPLGCHTPLNPVGLDPFAPVRLLSAARSPGSTTILC